MKTLPDEVLYLIFSKLAPVSLNQAQLTCRSWYRPAHISRLRHILLAPPRVLERFIAYFDEDANPTCINAVGTLLIICWENEDYVLSKENARILFKFPNLEEVIVMGKRNS